MDDPSKEAERHLITLAVQYQVAGRSAALCQVVPVAGNLLHHGIEMILKALLVPHIGLTEVRKLGHNLEKTWQAVVVKYSALDSPDRRRTIGELHRFETLRYPDSVIAEGAAIRFGWEKSPPMPPMTVPTYDLAMEEVDELFRAVFLATGKNPEFFAATLSKKARAALLERNRYLWWDERER